MIRPIFPNLKAERDNGGVMRQALVEDLLFPSEIKSETHFNWLGKPQESVEECLGIKRRAQFSSEGRVLTERTDFFGACTVINNYNPETGQYIGSFLEVEDE